MPPQHIPRKPPSLLGLTDEEKKDAMEKWEADRNLQERISYYEFYTEMERQAMRNELRVSEAQWRIIEPKYKRQIRLMKESSARSNNVTRIFSNKDKDLGFKWIKPTESKQGLPKTFAELPEAYRNVDKLVDLLRREDTTDEEFRKQIDALQQAREEAREERPKAKQELVATLTTPRQEAVFLLMGFID